MFVNILNIKCNKDKEKDYEALNKEIQDLMNEYNKTYSNKDVKENKENQSVNNNPNGELINKKESSPQKLDLSDINEDENLIKFMENLDYDKYVKNMEVREALFLLKNKVEKEKDVEDRLEDKNNENNPDKLVEELQDATDKAIPSASNNLPIIEAKQQAIHDKDWNEKGEDPEIIKKRVADKILKIDKVSQLV